MKINTKYFQLCVSPLFFIVITLLLTFSVNSTVIIALFSSILHECGHLAVLLKYKCIIKSVTLSFYGMKILRENEISLGFKKEITVCLSGVTVNFILSAVFFIISTFYKSPTVLNISAVNIILGLFNSLPVGSLDGARALVCILKYKFDLLKSERLMRVISTCIIIPVILLGIYLLKTNGNFTLLICCVYLIVNSYSLSY